MISLPRVRYSPSGLLAVWGLVVGSGVFFLEGYAARPGDSSSPPVRWPEESPIRRDVHASTLLIFLHPLCPCSRASVEELGNILNQCGHRVSTYALLCSATDFTEARGRSAIEQDLGAIPNARTWRDRGGTEARRFGAGTSGQVVLYDAQGRLSYSGGITAARGHRGDNYGRAAVIDRILGKAGDHSGSPVFGCPLSEPDMLGGERRRQ